MVDQTKVAQLVLDNWDNLFNDSSYVLQNPSQDQSKQATSTAPEVIDLSLVPIPTQEQLEQIRDDIKQSEQTKLELYRKYVVERAEWKPMLMPYEHEKCTADCKKIPDPSNRYHLCIDSGIIHDCTPSTCEYLITSGESMVCTATGIPHGHRLTIERSDVNASDSGFQVVSKKETKQQKKNQRSSITQYHYNKHMKERKEDNLYRTVIGNTQAFFREKANHSNNKRRLIETKEEGADDDGESRPKIRRRRRKPKPRKHDQNEKDFEMVTSVYSMIVGDSCECKDQTSKKQHKDFMVHLCLETWKVMESVRSSILDSKDPKLIKMLPKEQYNLKLHTMCMLTKTREGLRDGPYQYIPLIKCISNKIPDYHQLKYKHPQTGTLTKPQGVMRRLFKLFNRDESSKIHQISSKYHITLPITSQPALVSQQQRQLLSSSHIIDTRILMLDHPLIA